MTFSARANARALIFLCADEVFSHASPIVGSAEHSEAIRGLHLPHRGRCHAGENLRLPLTREVAKTQVLTEGEKTDVLQNLRFFSLSHLPLTAFPKVVKPPPLSQPFG